MVTEEYCTLFIPNYSPQIFYNTHSPLRILLAEDDFEMRKMLSWYLQKKGCNVIASKNGDDLMRHLGFLGPSENFNEFDLIISDIRMPGVTGIQVLENAKEFDDFPPMILITAFPDKQTLDLSRRLGAAALLTKPFDMDDLLAIISQIFPLWLISEKAQLPLSKQESVAVRFPLDLCLRHDLEGEHIKDFVYNMAAKLNRFSHHIEHCRVVLDQSGTHHQKNRLYHVMITIDIPGKTIAVKHDSETEAGFENLYISIQFAFGAAIRRLKRYLKKCSSAKRGLQI
jgi:CheY-like chemotaxis protein/ribosome-associated translation inhibitor RaiA